MAKSLTEIRSLARSRTSSALNVLIAVMRDAKSPPAARIAAANAILDRGWGKPPRLFTTARTGLLNSSIEASVSLSTRQGLGIMVQLEWASIAPDARAGVPGATQ